jgi:hypothetical protein
MDSEDNSGAILSTRRINVKLEQMLPFNEGLYKLR